MRCFWAYILGAIILYAGAVHSQNVSQQLDNRNGLSNSCVNSIYQDADHLIWFGTWDGLNYYDGANIHVFNYERADYGKRAIASNVIYDITGDRDGFIWIATVQGVSKFDKHSGNFTNYFYNAPRVSASGYTVSADTHGAIYAAHLDNGELYRFNRQQATFSKIGIPGLDSYQIKKIGFDSADNLWLLRDNGILECYNQTAKGLERQKNQQAITNVDKFFYCNGKIFYVTKSKYLWQASAQGQTRQICLLPREVRDLAFFGSHYYLAWASHGLDEYDQAFNPVNGTAPQTGLFKSARFTALMANDNLLWAGTDGNGVIKLARQENLFGLVSDQTNGQPFHIPVRAFCQVGNELWVGTKGNGIVTVTNLGQKNVSFGNIKAFHTVKDQLDNCVYTIKQGNDGLIYIGSDAPGVTLYDERTKKMVQWPEIANPDQFSLFGSVHCVLSEPDSSVWLGLNDSGLAHLKLERDNHNKIHIAYLKIYKHTGLDNGPGSNVIYSLAHGSNNSLWIGSRYGGLSLFDKSKNKFRALKAFSYKGSLSNNDVLSLYIDEKKRLWVGTSFGLNWINEEDAVKQARPQFKKLNVEDGLPNNTIHAITEDNSGNMWISTNKGLARITPEPLKIVQFKESDGLQSDEFSDNAMWKDPSGMLYFGGIYGFNYFNPQNIRLNANPSNLLITQMRFAGKRPNDNDFHILRPAGPYTPENYELAPQGNYFELGVHPISFRHNRTFQYAYHLAGNEKDWHYALNDQKIIYNNLPPGNYTLKIKWSDGEGAWTDERTIFTLRVQEFIWLTPWAYLVYALIVFGVGYLYVRYRKNKFLMTRKLEIEQMIREKDESLHQQQLSFFTNIAHELQTPLTLILGALNRYLYKNDIKEDQSGNYFITVVKQEASRLHYLVLQLLEFRKAASGFSTNHYRQMDVSQLVTNIGHLFAPLAEAKSLQFSLSITPHIQASIDKDKVEKILYNLLSNAVKYTSDRQSVVLSVNTLNEDDRLEITVSNSGCTLTDAEVQKVFDQFFVIDPSQQNRNSSGIGLTFTRQLVSMLNGTITVSCNDGWITFRVLLPLSVSPGNTGNDAGSAAPSSILQAITHGQLSRKQTSVDENNKKAMIKSFEQEDKKMVLVVEDEEQIRFLLKDILSEHYIVYEAASGKEALEVIRRITPDLIISDIMMPDLNGLEFCNIIKSTPDTCHIPFVILSARGTNEQQMEGYENGADAYLPKPFQTEHLLVRVNNLLTYRARLHRFFMEGKSANELLTSNDIKQSDKNFIEKVTKIIEDNLTADLDGAFLEDAMNMSKIQFYRKVKTMSNMTPTELIRHLRLQKAAILLRTSDLTVSEIFYRTGFNNKTYFFREFKKIYNSTPNIYREQHRLPHVN